MRKLSIGLLMTCVIACCAAVAFAQSGRPRPPEGRERPEGRRDLPPPPPPNRVIEALDTDDDGIISAQELAAAVESLKKLDKNGDGQLSERELRPQPGPRQGGPRDARNGDRRPPRPERRPPGPLGEAGRGGGAVHVLPPFARDELQLTFEQLKKIEAIEADVTAQLHKLLTPQQVEQLSELHRRGPGDRPDGPPGAPRRGRPPRGGGPPDDDGEDDES